MADASLIFRLGFVEGTLMPVPSLRRRFGRSLIVSVGLLALGVTVGFLSAVWEIDNQEAAASHARLTAGR